MNNKNALFFWGGGETGFFSIKSKTGKQKKHKKKNKK